MLPLATHGKGNLLSLLQLSLEPTTEDALHLVNRILDDLNTAYPDFDTRFDIEKVLGDGEETTEAPTESA